MRARVFVTQPIAESALERLRSVADVEVNPDNSCILSKDRLCDAVRKHDIVFALLHDTIDSDVLTANPKLKAVASMSASGDRIDVAVATAHKIPVTVIPAIAVSEATADLHFGLILAVARRIVEGDRLIRAGSFPGAQSNRLAGAWVWGKVLGLVGGKGRIGQAVARRARGFGMRILYCGPRRMPAIDEDRFGMAFVPLDQLLVESDFVSLHPALSPETRHMIGERELLLMKRTAFLVNSARGPIVDEKALVRALAEKRIAGAGLDVFENEPMVEPALLKMTNVVLTPHLGSAVMEVRETLAHIVVDNIMALLEGQRPPNCINPEVYAV
ncbi:MAG: D-glycerate dehydrogenase [Deltaproteobacteria bacterium]|nr:D-glycerate dehydrogenase [Deltaproteobacteria bacterium]